MSTDKTPAKVDKTDAEALVKLMTELHSVQENTPEAKLNETSIEGKDGKRIKLDRNSKGKYSLRKKIIKP